MRMIAKWFLLLNKRLYKKITFIIILALIPIVVLGLGIIAQQESGIATIALAQQDNTDRISNEIITELTQEKSLLRFVRCDTPEDATESVRLGQSDSAWIFGDNMVDRLNSFREDPDAANAIVSVIEREQNVLLRISREKLSNALYKYLAKDLYVDYVRTHLSELDNLTDDRLIEYYDSILSEVNLFEFGYTSASGYKQPHYLVAPVRGLLSVLIVLCSMASAMFFIQDEKRGTFSWVPQSRKIYIEFVCQVIAVANVSIVMFIALQISGLIASFTRELAVLVLYIIAVALFGMILRQLFNSLKILGALIPIFITTMIAVCPVFFDNDVYIGLTMLFPPTYYINAANNTNFIKYLAVYIVCCLLIIAIINVAKRLKQRLF